MAKRREILAGMPGIQPFMMTLTEAAALCNMNPGYFRSHCTVKPVSYNKKLLYPTEDVKEWVRAWYLKQTEQDEGSAPLPDEDWVEERFSDDQDAA